MNENKRIRHTTPFFCDIISILFSQYGQILKSPFTNFPQYGQTFSPEILSSVFAPQYGHAL
nr:hypothetical protein [Brachyspira aalborgi]